MKPKDIPWDEPTLGDPCIQLTRALQGLGSFEESVGGQKGQILIGSKNGLNFLFYFLFILMSTSIYGSSDTCFLNSCLVQLTTRIAFTYPLKA